MRVLIGGRVHSLMPRVALQFMLTVLAVLPLSACVTESSPVFNTEVSQEQALQDYLQLSLRYYEQDDLVNTKRHLGNLLELDPGNSAAHAIWGLVYAREGDLELADRSFRRAIREDGSNSRARNNYAAFLFAQGRYEAAYEQLEAVVRDTTYPARPQAFENLGLAALRLERPEEAEEAFNRALQLNRNQLRASLELADISLGRQDLEGASTFYRNYLTLSQFYQIDHSPRSLWVGLRLEQALGNAAAAGDYARLLEERFPTSSEYQLYQQNYQQSRDD